MPIQVYAANARRAKEGCQWEPAFMMYPWHGKQDGRTVTKQMHDNLALILVQRCLISLKRSGDNCPQRSIHVYENVAAGPSEFLRSANEMCVPRKSNLLQDPHPCPPRSGKEIFQLSDW